MPSWRTTRSAMRLPDVTFGVALTTPFFILCSTAVQLRGAVGHGERDAELKSILNSKLSSRVVNAVISAQPPSGSSEQSLEGKQVSSCPLGDC